MRGERLQVWVASLEEVVDDDLVGGGQGNEVEVWM